ncbi:MAG: hypothetical protein GF411_16415 [Candidatus Lokiarchaeota archaeon]|nr:hypothetical protein [Candidatus Lokiarchaeota archaeon]
MAKKLKYNSSLRKYLKRYNLFRKLDSIVMILGEDAQQVIEWAQDEAQRLIEEQEEKKSNKGRIIFKLVGREAAIRLVQFNHERGRLTTKSEVKKKTGQKMEMPLLYQHAGVRHPQEARNLRHNLFHEAFVDLSEHLFGDVETRIPQTGEGLTPDLVITHKNPNWEISVEYKGYRSLALLSESEMLKGMRYQAVYGTSWLVTTTQKTVRDLYGDTITVKELVNNGIPRLKTIRKKRAYTEEQKENRGISRKGIKHLEKHRDLGLKCKLISADELLKSCFEGHPIRGLAVTNGMEFYKMLKDVGLDEHAENILQVMKVPTYALHSDSVTSVRLIG